MNKLDIRCFIVTYNEADIIRQTIEHYKKICSYIVVYDNYSTDGTDKICKKLGCHVESFGSSFFDDRYNIHVKNEAWKHHRGADLIICIDADEIIDGDFSAKHDIYKCVGYNMYSETIPNTWDGFYIGVSSDEYSKPAVFNPKTVVAINYGFGAHGAKPIINSNYHIDKDSLSLRHMRYVGGVDRMISRYAMYKERLSDFNLVNKFGFQYLYDIEKIRQNWIEISNVSKPIDNINYNK